MAALDRRALVLVVDDEEPMLEVFTETIERLGVDVVGETGPRRAEASVRGGERYDVVVLDLRMPHLGGIALLERIRGRLPDVPVIVVTGYPSQATLDRCRALGVAGYLRKPFDPAELARHVRRALRSPRSAALTRRAGGLDARRD